MSFIVGVIEMAVQATTRQYSVAMPADTSVDLLARVRVLSVYLVVVGILPLFATLSIVAMSAMSDGSMLMVKIFNCIMAIPFLLLSVSGALLWFRTRIGLRTAFWFFGLQASAGLLMLFQTHLLSPDMYLINVIVVVFGFTGVYTLSREHVKEAFRAK